MYSSIFKLKFHKIEIWCNWVKLNFTCEKKKVFCTEINQL